MKNSTTIPLLTFLPNIEEVLQKLRDWETSFSRSDKALYCQAIFDRLPSKECLESIREVDNPLAKTLAMMLNLSERSTFSKEDLRELIAELSYNFAIQKYSLSDYHMVRFLAFYDLPFHRDVFEEGGLKLTNIAAISDKEALHVIRLYGCLNMQSTGFITEYSPIEKIKSAIAQVRYFPQHVADYLREQKYAIPYGEMLVADMVEIGWVKLI